MMRNTAYAWLWISATLAAILALPAAGATVTITVSESGTGSNPAFGEIPVDTSRADAVAGLVVLCETGVSSSVPTNPGPGQPLPSFPIQSSCMSGPNLGISDILGFQFGFSGPGSPVLGYQLASNKDDTSFADNSSINLGNPNPFPLAPFPTIFINAPTVALVETLGLSGSIEYEPASNQPGYFQDANGNTPIYDIESDCTPVVGQCVNPLPNPQMPNNLFSAEGRFSVGGGSIITPEPTFLGVTGLALGCLCWRTRRINRRGARQ